MIIYQIYSAKSSLKNGFHCPCSDLLLCVLKMSLLEAEATKEVALIEAYSFGIFPKSMQGVPRMGSQSQVTTPSAAHQITLSYPSNKTKCQGPDQERSKSQPRVFSRTSTLTQKFNVPS